MTTNKTLIQHGFEGTETVNVHFGRRDLNTMRSEKWVVSCEGRNLASGFNTEEQAREWVKRKQLAVVAA